MNNDWNAIAGKPNVKFDSISAVIKRAGKSGKRIFGTYCGRTAMSDD